MIINLYKPEKPVMRIYTLNENLWNPITNWSVSTGSITTANSNLFVFDAASSPAKEPIQIIWDYSI